MAKKEFDSTEYPPEIRELIEAAKDMPRHTPAPGGAGTIHTFKIDAATVWALDKALNKLGIKYEPEQK